MIEEEDIVAIEIENAIRNYQHYPNVCGVSYGSKFSHGTIDPGRNSIQFFVTEKVSDEQLTKSLPRFIYARNPDGSLDRKRKLITDVIELDDLKLCCFAGNEIASGGVNGTTTLIFTNKVDLGQTMVITCSHVLSGLDRSPPPNDRMVGGNDDCLFVARALGNSIVESGVLEYDIAIGEVTTIDDGFKELKIAGETHALEGFADSTIFKLDQTLAVSSDVSKVQYIAVNSARTRLNDIKAGGGRVISAGNIFVCTGSVELGDSGGIVYDGSRVAGIVIGKAKNDWVLIQPLKEALSYLSEQLGIPIECF